MPQQTTIPDGATRILAETTFDQNVVVLAGAGTGKTTLLVNRVINALMREPHPLAITELLALTFTRKAATEMKVRLRERLQGLVQAAQAGQAGGEPWPAPLLELRERYRLSASAIAERAEAALRDMEKAQIGTLHSFAAHLLRLHPIESGVDPGFREDEGDRFDEHFRVQWESWISRELGAEGSHHKRWRRILGLVSVAQLRDFARALCSELVSLEELRDQLVDGEGGAGTAQGAQRDWVETVRARGAGLLTAHCGPKPRKLETRLAHAVTLFDQLAARGLSGLSSLDPALREELAREIPSRPKGWTETDYAEARAMIRMARQVFVVDHELLRDVVDLLEPLVGRVRETFVGQGWMSFDGLLARARRLLRDHPRVRERLKHAYRSILIDEFQDTDPVQYEIVLYLAERHGCGGRSWSAIDLEPGKLFIVGDPKQSIYAFRRADIEAFHRVVAKIEETGGTVRNLVTNFRSSPAILQVINPIFDVLLHPEEHVQPGNVRLEPQPDRREHLRAPGVERRLVKGRSDDEGFDTAAATRAEAEALAVWLKRELRDGEALVDEQGRQGLRPGHVGILFHKLTQAQAYLDALRRHDIPYVTEGEKHFYRRQEVIDFLNVLRTVENPCDAVATVGVLRSPLGGLIDREIYDLAGRGGLDCRLAERLDGWDSPSAGLVRRLYTQLRRVSQVVHGKSLPEAVTLVFELLPVQELAAGSLHGEQALANLHKVRKIAEQVADRPHLTLTGFVELMARRINEEPAEGEAALGEASLDAVQVLTIHKAKGLEFPLVVLPGLHQGGGSGASRRALTADWSTGVLGVVLADRCNLGALLVGQKTRVREEAERRRVLYVGMTRAKERLVLSGGLVEKRATGSFLGLLEEAGCPIGREEDGEVLPPDRILKTEFVLAPERKSARGLTPRGGLNAEGDWTSTIERWRERNRRYEEIRAMPVMLTPTMVAKKSGTVETATAREAIDRQEVQMIGTLTHRALETWEFGGSERDLHGRVEAVCRHALPPEREASRTRIAQEIEEVLRLFMRSPAYEELRQATILGREIPFLMPWPIPPSTSASSQPSTMAGAIDVLYRKGDRLWVADYKTDRVSSEVLEQRVESYRAQAQVYRAAGRQALGLEKVGCKLIFLRHGLAVEVE